MNAAEIKSLMVAHGGTPTERCIALLIASGMSATKDIAEALGVTLRAVQKAKQRTSVREPEFASEPQDANHSSTPNHSSPKSEPQFVSQPSETRAHATKELPSEVVISKGEIPPLVPQVEKNGGMPAHVKPITDWSQAFSADLPDCEIVNDRIVLRGAMRAEALEDFDGDERRLAKALDQAAGWVQPNSSRPLAAQVRAQLAKIVGDRIDRDKRASKPVVAANGKPTVAEVMARMAARHQAEAAA